MRQATTALLTTIAVLGLATQVQAQVQAQDQTPSQAPRYEVIEQSGIKTLLLPVELSSSLMKTLKNTPDEASKITLVSTLLTVEVTPRTDGSATFCTEAGPVYKSINRNEAEMTAHCEDVFKRTGFARDLVKGVDDEYLSTLTEPEFRLVMSQFISIMLKM